MSFDDGVDEVEPKGFKPLFKSDFSAMGRLMNDVFPSEVVLMLGYVKMMEQKVDIGIELSLAWLAANIPPYKKYFKDYDSLLAELDTCRAMRDAWMKDNRQLGFPITLKRKLYSLYENWWEAYNDSGAGIRGTKYVPFEKRVKEAFRNL